jgi:hypothetical protein
MYLAAVGNCCRGLSDSNETANRVLKDVEIFFPRPRQVSPGRSFLFGRITDVHDLPHHCSMSQTLSVMTESPLALKQFNSYFDIHAGKADTPLQ